MVSVNPTRALAARKLGQSLWYDNISRQLLENGEIQQWIRSGVITGITTNPTIFHKAVEGSSTYDAAIHKLRSQHLKSKDICDRLMREDVAQAADLLRTVHADTEGRDGYVSLELPPSLAHDSKGSVAEAQRLFRELGRPNVMIKVPGTAEGVEAFRQLIDAGVNVNVTLLFSVKQYEAIALAYQSALKARAARKEPLSGIASVASFFVSRVDTKVDAQLEKRIQDAKDAATTERARSLRARVGIANSRIAYARFRELFGRPFEELRSKGARAQRMLWASTSTKNPSLPDTLYADALLGPDTVNTLPTDALLAFLDHGTVKEATILQGLADAHRCLQELAALGIHFDSACEELQKEGVSAFAKSYDALISSLEKKLAAAV